MKKILFVIDSLNSGGAEKSLVSLLSLLDYKKYDVDLLMFSPSGLYLPLLPKEVNILSVPPFIKLQSESKRYLIKNKKFKALYLKTKTSIALRNKFTVGKMHSAQIYWRGTSRDIEGLNKNYDVAIAYSQGIPTYYVAEKVQAEKKICWINTDYKMAPYNPQYDKDYYLQYKSIVAVSTYNRDVFVREMPIAKEKTKVIYDIVSSELVKSMSLNDTGFKDDFQGIRILTIGRLVESKGYDMAIEAAYKFKKQGYQFKWYAIGEGSLKSDIEKKVKELNMQDNFILLGTYQNPYAFLKNCDIYVQPSRFEGYGLAIAEARILQKPIVATNFTTVHNQIENKENGLIVNMDAESIYQGVREIIENKDLRDNILKNLQSEAVGTEREINKLYSLIEDKE